MPENASDDVASEEQSDVDGEETFEEDVAVDDDAEAPVGLEPPELELPTTPLAVGRLAFHAGDLEAAVEAFSEVLADGFPGEEGRAKAMYWRAEALMQQDYSRSSIRLFEEVAREFAGHSLAAAAAERARELEAHFDAIDRPDPVIDEAEEA